MKLKLSTRPMRRGLGILAIAALAILGQAEPSTAELNVSITQGSSNPLPIAVTNFVSPIRSSKNGLNIPPSVRDREAEIGRDISSVIRADLERSGLFKPIDSKAFIDVEKSIERLPKFNNWRVLKAQALTQGSVTIFDEDRVKVQYRLWDVFAEKHMRGQVYSTVPSNWRRIAHIIADDIYKRITGENGYFDTRIVYIAEADGRPDRNNVRQRIKGLAIMDQDGENHEFLIKPSQTLVLTPRFSPNRQEITYMSYHGLVPRVYLFNIDSGKQEVLGEFEGMTFAPRFSPDGNGVIMSMAFRGNSEIYAMDLRTLEKKQLTRHSAIDTSPYYSPDGSKIVFNSDRSGTQQLYIMDSNGRNVHRISFGNGRYATPVWSPRGDLIAFTKISGGKFFIGVMTPEGKGERLLADGFLVESPTWAPNGRVLMFFRETPIGKKGGKVSKLFSIDLTGHNEREIVTPMDASDPAWSPLIP